MDRLAEDRQPTRTRWTTGRPNVGTTPLRSAPPPEESAEPAKRASPGDGVSSSSLAPSRALGAMTTRSVQEVGERLGYEARDVLEALLETVADAVYVVDKDGRVAFANPAALALLGYEEHELLGHVSH